MSRNRRNHYRLLHVQPEAPVEIVKAAYRTLMGPLRQHPDLGGDHAHAALLNEAYAVLTDPVRRAAYDRTLTRGCGRGTATARPAPGAATASPRPVYDGPDPAHWRAEGRCPFCRAPLPEALRATTRCSRCESPLAPMPRPEPKRKELFGARTATRMPKNHVAVLIPGPGERPLSVRMRDLSLTGVSVFADRPLALRQPIRIVDGDVEAVAVVVACRRHASAFTIHAELLTIRVDQRAGVFVSAHA
jgi:hypothetical protein